MIDPNVLTTLVVTILTIVGGLFGKHLNDDKNKAEAVVSKVAPKLTQLTQIINDIDTAMKDPAVTDADINRIIADAKVLISATPTTP